MMHSYQLVRNNVHNRSNPGMGAVILAGFISGTCSLAAVAVEDQLVGPAPKVQETHVYDKFLVAPSMPAAVGSVVRPAAPERAGHAADADPLMSAINGFYVELEASQVALGDEFADALQDNFWDLCVRV